MHTTPTRCHRFPARFSIVAARRLSHRALTALVSGFLAAAAVVQAAAPSLSPIPDQVTWEDEPIREVPFTVSDPDTAVDLLRFVTSLSFNSQEQGPGDRIIVGGSGTNRWLTINPPPDASGTAQAVVTAIDPGGL